MMLIAGPGGFPTPLDAYFLPLRVQKISAVRRPGKPNRSFISNRIISDPPFCTREWPGLTPGFSVSGALKLRPETCPNPLYTESYIDSGGMAPDFSETLPPSMKFSAWEICGNSVMMLLAGPGGCPTPLRSLLLPLRVQKINAVRRPAKASRSLTNNRIIERSSFLHQGMARAYPRAFPFLEPKSSVRKPAQSAANRKLLNSAVRSGFFSPIL
jgi:hypothetical protein